MLLVCNIGLPRKVSPGQLVYFTRQLAIMLRAGIPLVRALYTLSSQLSDKSMASVVRALALEVEQGDKLSEAMMRFPDVFPSYYVNMVKVAELGGLLEEIFHRLALFLEKQQRTKKKVLSALAYPAFILLVAILILLVIMTVVVPTFMKMFSEYGQDLPVATQILISISNFIRSRWWLGILAVLGLVGLYSLLMRIDSIRYRVDFIKLRLPLIGELLKRFYISRFCQTLGTLLSSGVPIITALEVVKDTLGNEVFRSIVQRLIFLVEEGEDLSTYLKTQDRVFPPLVVEMISIGEETGTLPSMLVQIADTYDDEIDLIVSSITSVIEPMLIVFMGLVVGFIVISLFLPLFNLTQIMSQ